MATAEDGLEDTVGPRLRAAGADGSKICIFKEVEDNGERRPLTIPEDIPRIQERIRANNAKLFIIDPFMAFLGGGVDSSKDHDIRRCLHKLANVAEEEGCTFLLLRHLNKTAGTKSDLSGRRQHRDYRAARVKILVAEDPDDPKGRILVCTKNNVAQMPTSLKFYLTRRITGFAELSGMELPTHGRTSY